MKIWKVLLAIYIFAFTIYVYFFGTKVQPADWMQIMLMTALVGVTIFYAWSAHRQAEASINTVDKITEQTIMASRPVIIQKAVHKFQDKYFSHFEVMNVGNGPAIELEVALLKKDKSNIYSHRETFLKQDDSLECIDAALLFGLRGTDCYVVCEYQLPFATRETRIWQQTWLPIKINESNQPKVISVVAGELEFREVNKKGRVTIAWSKPI